MLHSSKLEELADDNFKFDENGRNLSKQLENTVGKGEIARNEQFLLFPQIFESLVLQTRKNQGLFGKGFKDNYFTRYTLAVTERREITMISRCMNLRVKLWVNVCTSPLKGQPLDNPTDRW